MKKAVLDLFFKTGGFLPFHRFSRDNTLILTYHRFSEVESPFSISRSQFAEHLRYLRKHRRILSLTEISERLANGEALPSGSAVITIDDGYRDAYEIAFPILREFSVPATLFAVTAFLDREVWIWTDKMRFIAREMKHKESMAELGGQKIKLENSTKDRAILTAAKVNAILKTLADDEKEIEIDRIARSLKVSLPELPVGDDLPMTWDQAREMASHGIWIESHTVNHPILPNISDERLNFELEGSKRRLEDAMQRPIRAMCYPSGSFDERVWQAVRKCGYGCAVTTRHGFNTGDQNPFLLNRMAAQPNLANFAQSVSGFDGLKMKYIYKNASARPSS